VATGGLRPGRFDPLGFGSLGFGSLGFGSLGFGALGFGSGRFGSGGFDHRLRFDSRCLAAVQPGGQAHVTGSGLRYGSQIPDAGLDRRRGLRPDLLLAGCCRYALRAALLALGGALRCRARLVLRCR
jgi:hypothetical protein